MKFNIWDRLVSKAKDIDAWRKFHMSFAEWFDAWRIIPRLIVAGYSYLLWHMYLWYSKLEPTMIDGCNVEILKEACISQAPTTQHMALVTAAVGVAAAVFALYANSGKKWNGFTNWNLQNIEEEKRVLAPPGSVVGGRRHTDPPLPEEEKHMGE